MAEENAQRVSDQDQSMDNILSDIKAVITSEDEGDDVLELTEKVDEEVPRETASQANKDAQVANSNELPELSNPEVTSDSKQDPVVDKVTEIMNSSGEDMKENITEMQNRADAQSTERKSEGDILNAIDQAAGVKDSADSSIGGANDKLLNDQVIESSRESIKSLIKMTERSNVDSLRLRSGNTVEDIIIEMVKPQIGSWLNDNLPEIVRSVVEKEVKKLVPKDE
jgi:cell pole-organizing protein PopZ